MMATQHESYLRQLPADWKREKISNLARIVGGGTPARDVLSFWGGSIPWLTPGELSAVDSREISATREGITVAGLAASGAQLLPSRSLMVTTRATLGARAINSVPMTTNQGFRSLVFRNGELPEFYFYLTEKLRPEMLRRASGTTFLEISGTEFAAIEVPNPSVLEKEAIVQVLGALDTVIHQTEATIEKLKQVKQGLLHDLLTRGIDENGELRPPQSEAPHLYKESSLGWIPKEWEDVVLDDVAIRGSGHTPSKSVKSYWDGKVKWVSLADSENLDQIYIHDTDKKISELGIANSSAVKHPLGTVILSRDAGIGKSAVLGSEMAVSQHFMAWRCGNRLNNLFLYFWLQKEKPRFEAIALGSTIKTIGLSYFKKLRFACPLRSEQDRSANVLMSAESMISDHVTELIKLRMLKVGLMSDLLTGRVRVTPLLAPSDMATNK